MVNPSQICPPARAGYVFPSGMRMVATDARPGTKIILHVGGGEASGFGSSADGHFVHLLEHLASNFLAHNTPDGGRQSVGGWTNAFTFELSLEPAPGGELNSFFGIKRLMEVGLGFEVTQQDIDAEIRVISAESVGSIEQLPSYSRFALRNDDELQGSTLERLELRPKEAQEALASLLIAENVCIEYQNPPSSLSIQEAIDVVGRIVPKQASANESLASNVQWDDVRKYALVRRLHYPAPELNANETVGVVVIAERSASRLNSIAQWRRTMKRVARKTDASRVVLVSAEIGREVILVTWSLTGASGADRVAAELEKARDDVRYVVLSAS